MSVFEDGYCDYCVDGKGTYYIYHYNPKTRKDVEEEYIDTCKNCLGTQRKLTSLGKECVEFLIEIGIYKK